MEIIIKSNIRLLEDLVYHLEKLSKDEYNEPQILIMNASIGQHIRHIINFYQAFLQGIISGVINYDSRNRDKTLEFDKEIAILEIKRLILKLDSLKNKTDIDIFLEYINIDKEPRRILTSFQRELLYISEHTIHHTAIIRIVFEIIYKIQVNDDFGFAPSTLEAKKREVLNFQI